MCALAMLPQPALARVLSYLNYLDIQNLWSTCTALQLGVDEHTTNLLRITRPDEMDVLSSRLILGLDLVLDGNEDILKEMLRSFPKLEMLMRSHKYRAGKLKFSVLPMEDAKIANQKSKSCKGNLVKNMLSPWGHHLLGHHYLDMLLALHARLSLPLSHLDLQVDLLCESCQQFFGRLEQAEYLASNVHLNLRMVNLCFPERDPSSKDYLSLLATIGKVKSVKNLKLEDLPSDQSSSLSHDWERSGHVNNFHLFVN